MKAHTFKPGDIVRFTAKFLKSTGMVTGAPKDGKVLTYDSDLDPTRFIKVAWSDGTTTLVAASNVTKVGKPDYSDL